MITIRQAAYGEATAGQGTPLSVSARTGDLLVLITCSQFGHVGRGGVPSGWTSVYSDGSTSRNRSGLVAWSWATGPDDATNLQWWSTSPDNTSRQRALLLAVSGVLPDSTPQCAGWQADPDTPPTTGLVVAQEHGTQWAPVNTFTIDGAKVVHPGTASNLSSWSTLRALLTTKGGTLSPGTEGSTCAWTSIALQPAPETQAAGQQQTTPVVVVGSDGQRTPATPQNVSPSVPATVSGLLTRSTPWLVAHRGGSANWPEMSLKAYTESVSRGVEALELSFTLTSDGVAAALHDQTLQRVDPTAPDTPVGSMTWEQVRQYHTVGEPIICLQDLQAAFGQDHVLFIDPKYSAAQHATYLPWLDPERTILKFSGDAAWLADIWRRQGFTTWGYMYADSIDDGRAEAWARHWDLIGVPWDAPESTWAKAATYGKPILGHICPSQAALDACIGHGAVGAMCSAVDGLVRP